MKHAYLLLLATACLLLFACGGRLSLAEAEARARAKGLKIASELKLDLSQFTLSVAPSPDANGNWHFTWQKEKQPLQRLYVVVGRGGDVDWTASDEFFAEQGIRSVR